MNTEKDHGLPNPENPETFDNIELTSVKTVAAGLPAVASAFYNVLEAMNPIRGGKALLAVNQFKGFDCPGCAWPDPDDDRSAIAEYCENGAKAIAEEATTKSLKPDFFAKYSVAELSQLDDYHIGKKGRIAQPMYLAENATHYKPIEWKDAFEIIAKHLKALDSPDEATFYTSGRTSNEAAFLYQLFVRQFGTNNLPDCSNMCHESSGTALSESLGIGKGSVTLEDFYEAEVIIIMGQNPGTNHPRMLSALSKAKENGAHIIAVNPLPETGLIAFADPQSVTGILGIKAKLADDFLPVRINGDMALIRAINKILWVEEQKAPGTIFDLAFIEEKTNGVEEYLKSLDEYTLEELSDVCGISVADIVAITEKIKHKKKFIMCWAMGLTQHKNSVDSIKEIVNFLLLKGSIGKPGAGTCPVRGHSNVQGDRTMGIFERPPKWLLDKIEANFHFRPPQHHGLDVVRSIKAMHEGSIKVFFAMGGNFLSASPDTMFTAAALQKTNLTVQVSTKLNRSHLITGKEALILPTYGRSDRDVLNSVEQYISCENSMGVVQKSKGNLKPVSEHLMSEPVIVCNMAKAVFGKDSIVNWDKYLEGYDHIRNDIERTIPGFENYNERVQHHGGFYLPNSSRSGFFPTYSGKANFNVAPITYTTLADHEYLLMTIRSHDQFNTTIYGLNDRYRGILNERRVIFMNEDDAKEAGFKREDVVDIFNYHDGGERVARKFLVIPFNIPKRCVATYLPETNVLVPINSTSDKSNTPTSKNVVVEIKRHVG